MRVRRPPSLQAQGAGGDRRPCIGATRRIARRILIAESRRNGKGRGAEAPQCRRSFETWPTARGETFSQSRFRTVHSLCHPSLSYKNNVLLTMRKVKAHRVDARPDGSAPSWCAWIRVITGGRVSTFCARTVTQAVLDPVYSAPWPANIMYAGSFRCTSRCAVSPAKETPQPISGSSPCPTP
jgi:hypothetical protein